MIAISPYAKPGYVSHSYTDHVSILKFIERNWGLPPAVLAEPGQPPDPVTSPSNPYVPTNRPAIGDLFDMFNFGAAAVSGAGRLPPARATQTARQRSTSTRCVR